MPRTPLKGSSGPIEWRDGYVIPPTKPGIGIELDEAVADANPYTAAQRFPRMADRPVTNEIDRAAGS
jgi:hypothetical protein